MQAAAAAPVAAEGINLSHDRLLVSLAAASPLAQPAILFRLVEIQGALIRDLRNRLALLEGRQAMRQAFGVWP